MGKKNLIIIIILFFDSDLPPPQGFEQEEKLVSFHPNFLRLLFTFEFGWSPAIEVVGGILVPATFNCLVLSSFSLPVCV